MGFFDAFTGAGAQAAADAQKAAIAQGKTEATGAIGTGSDYLKNYYTQALQPYQTLFDVGMKGTSAYNDAMGLNGPEGNARAVAAFWNNPAIKSQLDIGSENVLRNQAATGALASGGTMKALDDYGQKVASGGWQNYVSSLSPYLNYGQTAGAGIANTNIGLGQGLNTNQGSLAGLDYRAATDTGNAQANADLAKQQANANMWNFGLNAVKAVTGMPSFGGGTSFSGGLNNFLAQGSGNPTAYSGGAGLPYA